jgi:di/tricarboxylate transporter
MKDMNIKQTVGLVVVVLILIGMCFIPSPEGLSSAGLKTIGLTLALLVFLICEILPMSITCFIFTLLFYLFGATNSYAKALSGFGNPIVMFIIASFALSAAFINVPLSKRILKGY